MKVLLDIPNYEFNKDIENKFQDYFERVKADIDNQGLCGNYERETTEMFLASFKHAQYIPDNATNGDIIKAVFPNMERKHDVSFGGWMESNWIECDGENITHNDWWNAPYKRGGENE